MKIPTLNDAFPSWMKAGVFACFGDWVPWSADDSVTAEALDIMYIGNRSGEKPVSSLLYRLIGNTDGYVNITPTNRSRLDATVHAVFGENWKSLWDALHMEYNPIENYDSNEETKTATDIKTEHAVSLKDSENKDIKKSRNIDEKDEKAEKVKESVNMDTKASNTTSETSTTKGSVTPLGALSPVEINRQETTNSGTGTNNFTEMEGLAEDNYTEREALAANNYNRKTASASLNYEQEQGAAESNYKMHEGDAEENFDRVKGAANDNVVTSRRHGNIGVTTTQQMLESHFELMKRHFFEHIFEDLDRLLTVPYYQ